MTNCTDANDDPLTYNWTVNGNLNSSTQHFNFDGSNFAIGIYNVTGYCNDDQGNFNSTNITMEVFNKTSYIFAVIPDSQKAVASFPHVFKNETQWIADMNIRSDIRFTMHEGDMVDDGDNQPTQWDTANETMKILDDDGTPYGEALGNHDYDTEVEVDRTSSFWNSYFNLSRKTNQNPSSVGKNDSNDNSYYLFNVSDTQYLAMFLEFCPTNETMNWVNDTLNTFSDRKAIITSHLYMFTDDTRYTTGDAFTCDSGSYAGIGDDWNDGEQMWDRVFSNHDNIMFITSGHALGDGLGYREDNSTNNNTVHQFLVNYQTESNGGNGWIRLMIMNPDTGKMDIRAYSPWLDQRSFTADEHFTVSNVNFTSASGPDTTPPTFTVVPNNASLIINQSLGVSFEATDDVGIDTFFINWTGTFSINESGYLVNVSELFENFYQINVSVNDTSNNINSLIYTVNVSNATEVTAGILTWNWTLNDFSNLNPSDICFTLFDKQYCLLSDLLGLTSSQANETYLKLEGGNMTGELNMQGNNISEVNFLKFNITSCPEEINTLDEGFVCWNADKNTLNTVTGLGNIVQLSQEMFKTVKNKAGRTIYGGQVVSTNSSSGELITVDLASGNVTNPMLHNLGVVTIPSCNNNAECIITYLGEIHDIDTSAFTEGDPVYLSCDGSGNITAEKQSFPNCYNRHLGIITRSHASTGILDFFPEPDFDDGNTFHEVGILSNLTVNGYTTLNNALNMTSNNITEIGQLIASDGSKIRFGTEEQFSDAPLAINIHNNQSVPEGEITHILTQDSRVLEAWQSGLPGSGGFHRNSYIISSDYGITNATQLTSCPFMINKEGIIQTIACNTTDVGAGLWIQGSAQIGHFLSVGGGNRTTNGLRVEGDADFFLPGSDFDIFNGSIHVRNEYIVQEGFTVGQNVSFFQENFDDGELDPFYNFDSSTVAVRDWNVVSSPNCFNDECARSIGGDGGAVRTMETNISSLNLDNLTLNFTVTTINIEAGDIFNVTINNNVGSGEVQLYATETVVTNSDQSTTVPESMSNKSSLSLRFYFGANIVNEEVYVNDILLRGQAQGTTQVNTTHFDTHIKLGDGFQEIFWNGTSNQLTLPVNTTEIQTADLNVTLDLTVGRDATIGRNTTSEWFNGLFNWTLGTIAEKYFDFNGGLLTMDESALNNTIDDRLDGGSPWVSTSTEIYNTTALVGIGTTSPSSPLEVKSTGTANTNGIRLENDGDTNPLIALYELTDTHGGISIYDGTTEDIRFFSGGTNFIKAGDFYVDSTTTFFVDASANSVGLGTNTPSFKLDIDGHLGFSGDTPTIATNACGSSTQGTVSGSDNGGKITVGNVAGPITSCALTFGSTWTTAPACTVIGENDQITLGATTSTTQLIITSDVGALNTDVLMYTCIGI
jgi:hypothetical protein